MPSSRENVLVICGNPFDMEEEGERGQYSDGTGEGIGGLRVNRLYRGNKRTTEPYVYLSIEDYQGCNDGGYYKGRFIHLRRRS